jgi:hypothetical protein
LGKSVETHFVPAFGHIVRSEIGRQRADEKSQAESRVVSALASGGFAVKAETAFCFKMKRARTNRMRF